MQKFHHQKNSLTVEKTFSYFLTYMEGQFFNGKE